MNQLDINKIIKSKYPNFLKSYPNFLKEIFISLLESLLYIKKINRFISKNDDKMGIELIEELFEMLDVSYSVSNKDRNKIPSEGKLLIVSNHPLGGLDGLILLKLISEIRCDVKIIANDVLMQITNLNNFFIPIDLFTHKSKKNSVSVISEAVKKENAIIIFPAGEVARFLFLRGIKDKKWKNGAVYFANKYQIPVLPVFINARNSFLFYFISFFHKGLSTLFLPHEIFNKRGKIFEIKIGDYISSEAFSTKYQTTKFITKSLKKHLTLIGKNKKGIFKTEINVIQPVPVKEIRNQLFVKSNHLGETTDGKKIFLVDYVNGKEIIKEISRLREITFRKVGEGTGLKNDSDRFDKLYKHLVLWDENELEIIGSYRLGFGQELYNKFGINGFYTSTLFEYEKDFLDYLPNSIELGRSFIQSKYWNSFALDYLWQGIGKLLNRYTGIKYLFGPVSLSNNFINDAKYSIVYFYSKWFKGGNNLISAKNPFIIPDKSVKELEEIFSLNDYNKELFILKSRLKNQGFSIPTLYKQYVELCLPGGIEYLDFNIDPDFQNCIDAFVLVKTSQIKKSKRDRYLNRDINRKFSFTQKDISVLS